MDIEQIKQYVRNKVYETSRLVGRITDRFYRPNFKRFSDEIICTQTNKNYLKTILNWFK